MGPPHRRHHRFGRQNHHQGSYVGCALGAKFRVLKSQGNLNNGFGLPLQLLRLTPEHEIAVVEMGMNHSGEIAALARIATPDWGVITNVGTAHIENFKEGQAGIARAKFELISALPSNGVAFLNCDDAYAAQFGRDFPGRVVYFGSGPCADPQILSIVEDLEGPARSLSAREREGASRSTAWRAQRYRTPWLASPSPSKRASISMPRSLRSHRLTAGDKRGQVIEIAGATILNDSYNSNPEALRSMIRTLAARPTAGRRILVAGRNARNGRARPRAPRRLWPRCRRGRPRPRRRRRRQC
jgi:UDP-N-acetylmuramoyl-tripeptide--D-alanyl-D-alanine ligase